MISLFPPQVLPVGFAAFAASLVECVEALTVVLAVGATRGWRNAFAGSAAALALLAVGLLAARPLLALLSLANLRFAIGILLLLFGLRWLRKAILRSAGVMPCHDEAETFEATRTRLDSGQVEAGWDGVGLVAALQVTLLEGLEVLFIIDMIAAGHDNLLTASVLGAVAAFLVVCALGFALHRPLTRVPENALKFTVGVLLCAYGTFWIGEGSRLAWPGGDWSLAALCAGFLAVALAAVPLCRRVATQSVEIMP